MSGRRRMNGRPRAARVANQIRVIGPKNRPTTSVPRDCTANRPSRMIAARGRTNGAKWAPITGAVVRPSTADSTEIAGVIRPSP